MDWTTWILIVILISLIPFAFLDILNHIQNFVIWRQKKSLNAIELDIENIDVLIDGIYKYANKFKDELKNYNFKNLNEDIRKLKKFQNIIRNIIKNIEYNIKIVQTIQTDSDGIKKLNLSLKL